MSRAAVFLDRDGVLNRTVVHHGKPYPPQTLDEFQILPDVETAPRRLKAAGFLLIVATNQPDATTARQDRKVIESMHEQLRARLPLDDIRVCWCAEGPDCACYKPKPGLLHDAAAELDIDLSRSFMVGDRWRDVGCGRRAGCFTIFVERGYEEKLTEEPDARCAGLGEAAEIILSQRAAG